MLGTITPECQVIARAIVEAIQPLAVVLIGSRARGSHREDSDYDLVVVVPDDGPALPADALREWWRDPENAPPDLAVRRALAKRARLAVEAAAPGVEANIFLFSASIFAANRDRAATFSHEALYEGIVLYEVGTNASACPLFGGAAGASR